jgi:cell division initiation protein
MLELSALDILGKQFSRRLRGYAPMEVHEFLSQIATSVEGLTRDRGELKQRVHRLEQELADYRERESALHEALVAAQRTAESTVAAARTESQKIIDDGHALADRLVEEANQRAQNIESLLSELRSRRREARSEMMRIVEVLEGFVRDDQKREQEERATPQLAVLQRRTASSSESSG